MVVPKQFSWSALALGLHYDSSGLHSTLSPCSDGIPAAGNSPCLIVQAEMTHFWSAQTFFFSKIKKEVMYHLSERAA